MRCTQWPTSAEGFGIVSDTRPLLIGFHVCPASSLRNAPAAEMAIYIRSLFFGSSRMVCRHMPPAPGCQCGPESCLRSPDNSIQLTPPSVDLNSAASSMPAYTVSASVSDGSRCQTCLNSHGCAVPSYHWCVPGTPSYSYLFPTVSHVLPPSLERCITCPNQPLDCDA